jgi:hypothetical protein
MYFNPIELCEDDVSTNNIKRASASLSTENEQPSLSIGVHLPAGVRWKFETLELELCAGGKKGSLVGKAAWMSQQFGWARIRHRKRTIDMQLALPSIIEKTKSRVATLLNFRDD